MGDVMNISNRGPAVPLVKAKVVANYLGVAECTINRLARSGDIPSVVVTVGGRRTTRRFRMTDVDAWVEKQTEKSAQAS